VSSSATKVDQQRVTELEGKTRWLEEQLNQAKTQRDELVGKLSMVQTDKAELTAEVAGLKEEKRRVVAEQKEEVLTLLEQIQILKEEVKGEVGGWDSRHALTMTDKREDIGWRAKEAEVHNLRRLLDLGKSRESKLEARLKEVEQQLRAKISRPQPVVSGRASVRSGASGILNTSQKSLKTVSSRNASVRRPATPQSRKSSIGKTHTQSTNQKRLPPPAFVVTKNGNIVPKRVMSAKKTLPPLNKPPKPLQLPTGVSTKSTTSNHGHSLVRESSIEGDFSKAPKTLGNKPILVKEANPTSRTRLGAMFQRADRLTAQMDKELGFKK